MNDYRSLLEEKQILIADGAWGTELAERGLAVGEAPERWNLDRAEQVREVAEAYVRAGADIILTNSFGGNCFKMLQASMGHAVTEINRSAAQLSRDAAGDDALVFGSVGPTGQFLEPLGSLTVADAVACFAEQIAALAAGGADAILNETQTDLGEAKAALTAAREQTELPVVVSMTFDQGARGYATMMGVSPRQAAEELTAAGADIVGANCGGGIEQIIEVIALMRPVTELPLWAKPNAGLPELVGGKTVFRQGPEEMASHFAQLVQAGATIVGGCCGTTPEHIVRLVAVRDRQCEMGSAR